MQNYSYHAHTHALNKYDGKNTVSEMIAKAEEIGFSELGITNHLCYHPNIPLSNPMSYRDLGRAVEDYRQIVEEIRTAARRVKIKSMPVLKSISFLPPDGEKILKKLCPP